MKYNCIWVISFTILILFILIISSSVAFSSEIYKNEMIEEIDQDSFTSEINITENSKWQIKSAIHGENIVWEDYRDDPFGTWASPGNRNSNIYLYNLEEEQTYQVTTNTSSQINPDIWENFVVWEDYRNGNADIYYTDISPLFRGKNIEIKQLTDDTTDQIKPKIHSGMVVWEDYSENHYGDIYLYNIIDDIGPHRLNTRDEENNLVPHRNPDIFENKVVWADYRNHWGQTLRGDIFLYDLSLDSNDNGIPNYMDAEILDDDPAEIEFATQDIHQHSPSIYKDTIVWIEYNSTNNNDIYYKRIGGERTQVSIDGMKDDDPYIYGDIIVYHKREFDQEGLTTSFSICYYDILENEHSLIREIPADPDRPSRVKARFSSVYQNKIVWEENHPSDEENINHQYDIFYTEIEPKEPVIRSAEVANQTKVFGSSTDMLLIDGNKIHFRVEVTDPNGIIEKVTANTSELTSIEYVSLKEEEQGVYKGTLEYSKEMLEGHWSAKIQVLDSFGNHIESQPLDIIFTEAEFYFSFVGVGNRREDLGNETIFVLEEGNSLFFVTDLSDFEGEVSRVCVNVSSFQLDIDEFELSFQEGIYLYEYEFEEDIPTGEKIVRFYALSERGQKIESYNLTVNIAIKPGVEPEIISYGVGKELSEMEHSIDFELKEGNYMYFVASIDHEEDFSYDVYLRIEGMENIKMIEKTDENTYYYRFEYLEGLELGEKTAHIYVEDDFGQGVTSGEININFIEPKEPLPTYYYIIPIIIIPFLILGILYYKKPEYFDRFKGESY